jgi:large subunit ribosomal protein L15
VKLHDLQPAPGSHRRRTRVGRGIAAGKGKTAGRGTKGQKARAGASIPAWFEGGQTPLHMRVPKLRGFRRLMRVEYQVVNVGRLSAYAEAGRLGDKPKGKAPYTVNPEILRAAGLITRERIAVKILGSGDVAVPIFVLADAFTRSAREKIEAAGGMVQLIAPPPEPVAAPEPAAPAAPAVTDEPSASAVPAVADDAAAADDTATEEVAETATSDEAAPAEASAVDSADEPESTEDAAHVGETGVAD